MTCREIHESDVMERYLTAQLPEAEREQFEQHYFGCEECYRALEAHRAVRAALAVRAGQIGARAVPAARNWFRLAVPFAVAAALLIATAVFIRGPHQEPPAPVAVRKSAPDFTALAQVRPPRYDAPLFRGSGAAADARFRQAMERYSAGDYAGALPGLREAAALDPRRPAFLFFLGASELLAGDTGLALEHLGALTALGASPFLDEAHLLLAHAWLRRNNPSAARAELVPVASGSGESAAEARDLLERIDRAVK